MIHRHLPDDAATQRLAEALAANQPRGAVVHLQGDLGAGKSTLARAWLRALGVTGTVRSPTYTLVERYPVEGGEALHLDLYRIGDAGEFDFLGLDDIDAALWLVEWPERGAAALQAPDLVIQLAIEGAGRAVELVPGGPLGAGWLAAVSDDPRLSALSEPKP
ncbi:tRNA threonylcarbamoyladenosine biosynthesis protein TsaE [Luteimonas sp. 9C]|uniref:tRNA (adenosine(37)-N6)-threonylcarbamoyltransferase complex ATPase subunit type 1 TsaE n=1 Tax=Luteimonas sp. 9C TaxID=2653148 RepID=UPI0012F412F6|nr:tRNA (adenosine(37)-N6)-threonylcarbamoyltransferase complex ATPase subunit type 1 TsaE [Luteimonas sp. 9C]VXB79815.1 tRNA threonylcarbamoyladenosine biosynthesis protein TsaE [Luteimonas sp. 9C]